MILYPILLLLGLCAAGADLHHYRRLLREKTSVRRRRIYAVWAAATDALPFGVAVAGMLLRDNTTAYMLWAMWLFWAWMIAVFPRICFFFFNALRLPRVGIVVGAAVALLLLWGATAGRTSLRT
ncbi:MAG: metallophosphoesterase, partial [Alistipes sp.]|nr:metallophosphoesterase [Alistipes sp.]